MEKEVEDTEPINNVFTLAMKTIESDLVSAGIIDNLADVADNEKKKIEVDKDDFIKCIAVCSQFKLKMPYDFALRILKTYKRKNYPNISKIYLFVITQDYHENYEISLRTPLEAAMYLSAKNLTTT